MNRVLIISGNTEIISTIQSVLSEEFEVENSDSIRQALEIHTNRPFDLIFIDLQEFKNANGEAPLHEVMTDFQDANPMIEYAVLTSQSGIREAFKAVKAGASDYITYPLDPEEIRLVVTAFKEAYARDHELTYLRNRFWKTEWIDVIHTRNPHMINIYETIRSVAPTIANILLLGETGTGKGLLARLIHIHSNRNDKPFLSVHCGAIPDTLLESELFGHEKGAFTGAVRRKAGKFEIADGGTIFLDEIGTISSSAQVKLLQVLQDKTFSRVGGEEPLKADVRIIAATNADLKELAAQGRFRKDLYYRLNVFPIVIPPLRQRVEDIPHMVEVFLKKLNQQYGKNIQKLHPKVIEALKRYEWPGNIRELENVLERSYILEKNGTLMPPSFPLEIMSPDFISAFLQEPGGPLSLNEARRLALEDFEQLYVKNLIARNKGKINLSAKEAQITPRQLNRLMSRYRIKKSDYRS
ncbi:MAG: sigma-54 dependent transcriptional regulator [Pseudomonadota bacterium]